MPKTAKRTLLAIAAPTLLLTVSGARATPWKPAARPAARPRALLAPPEVTLGESAQVGGVAPAGPGLEIRLAAAAWPYRAYTDLAETTSGPGGAFSFPALRPRLNTRLRVSVAGLPAAEAQTLELTVDPRVRLRSRSEGPGRVLLTLGVRHAVIGPPRETAVSWYLAAAGSSAFHLAGRTRGVEASPGLLTARATVDPPSRRFRFRVCLNPPWEAAMGPRGAHGPCPAHGFVLPRGSG